MGHYQVVQLLCLRGKIVMAGICISVQHCCVLSACTAELRILSLWVCSNFKLLPVLLCRVCRGYSTGSQWQADLQGANAHVLLMRAAKVCGLP